ncbi:hypothetical protein DIPPA_16910 [Diplonema papillatum]|nr:hypothetical protein DIPPA_16910 [Diplonema papillatum]
MGNFCTRLCGAVHEFVLLCTAAGLGACVLVFAACHVEAGVEGWAASVSAIFGALACLASLAATVWRQNAVLCQLAGLVGIYLVACSVGFIARPVSLCSGDDSESFDFRCRSVIAEGVSGSLAMGFGAFYVAMLQNAKAPKKPHELEAYQTQPRDIVEATDSDDYA